MQFSLKMLFGITLLAAIICAAMFSMLDSFGALTLALLTAMFHAVEIVGIIYGSGYVRVFAIGATIPILGAFFLDLVVMTEFASHPITGIGDWDQIRIQFAVEWLTAILCGVAACLARWSLTDVSQSAK